MKKLFLTSVFSLVGDRITEIIPSPAGLRVAFVATAAEIYEYRPWLEADRQKLIDLGFVVVDYDIKGKTEEIIYTELQQFDVIFVSGGNTFYLLYQAQQSGLTVAIKRLIEEGVPYIGSSAGSIFVGPSIALVKTLDDPREAPNLDSDLGVGVVDFAVLPHYRDERLRLIQAVGDAYEVIPLTDTQALVVEGEVRRVVEVKSE